ncbi:MAG: hypothetical protein E7599_06655 [Ruminococcaceae bacterium]|nr:hypothetical protein [Oscillospiraceae bacterium]
MNNVNKKAIGNLLLKILIVVVAIVAVIVIIALCIKANSDDRLIRKELTVEAGSTDFSAADFLRDKSKTARFSQETQYTYNINKVGTYHLQLIVGEDRYNVVLHVVDTVAPVAHSKPMLVAKGTNLIPENLLTGPIQDATAVTATFLKAPDTNRIGQQDVSILLEDEGNQTLLIETVIYVTTTVNPVLYQMGEPYPELSQFIGQVEGAHFSTPLSDLDISAPGTYYLDVDIFDSTYSVVMEAVDTILPVATPVNGIQIYPGDKLPAAKDLVTDVFDATALTFEYADNYAFYEPGEYQVVVHITDLAGNVLRVVVTVRVLDATEKDTDPPVISGAVDLVANIGSIIVYAENVTVYDARDGKLDLSDANRFAVDKSAVRENVVGTYPVTYTATDRSGNSTSVTVNLHIKHMEVSDEAIYAYAESVLSEIVTKSMNDRERIEAIYRYVYALTENFKTDVTSDVNDRYTRLGYYGFLGYGTDAYAATGMMQTLFDLADIEYRVVDRASNDFMHRWLLVDFGDGWFHVDALQNGYVWTTDGRVLKSDSKEAEELEIGSIRFTYEMTDSDLALYTQLMDAHRVGWKYYEFNTASHPRTPIRNQDGSYTPTYYTIKYITGIGGVITGVATQRVAHGVDGSKVVATPNFLYKFVRWDDGVTSAERVDRVNGDRTYKAIFAYDHAGVEFFTVQYLAGIGGYVTGNTEQLLQKGSESAAVTAVASMGYRFVGWSDGVTEATRTDIVAGDMTVTALFEELPKYNLYYLAMPGGKIEGKHSQDVTEGQTGSAVTAVANPGYRFVGWSDGVTEATRTDVANGALMVSARFEVIPTHTLKYEATLGGIIEGEDTQSVLLGGVGLPVTAIPMEGYYFVKWSDGLTNPTRSDVVNADMTLTAEFAEDKTVIYVDAGHGFANSYGQIDKGTIDTVYTEMTGKYESDLNLAVALKVKQLLLTAGYEVIMTRESESEEVVTVADRVEMVNASRADLFVSIHADSYAADKSVKGCRVYYSSQNENADECKAYAQRIAAGINASEGASLKTVTVKDHENIAVLRGITVPTALVETCFLTSPEDVALAMTDAWLIAMAEGICAGITAQLNK